MSKGTGIVGMLVALVLGFWLGNQVVPRQGSTSETTAGSPGAESAGEAVKAERLRVPLGPGPIKGSDTAKITIIEFSDFQCPFCSRVVPTLKEIEKAYGKDVRVQFRNNPLPFHDKAQLAAEAAVAAGAQGKFWEMHDKLFANQQKLDRPDLERYAQEIGLDVSKFKAALDSGAGRGQIQADKTLAQQLGANGTPSFFINGRLLAGAQPFEKFKEVIDQEVAYSTSLLKEGTPPNLLYAKIIEKAKSQATPPTPTQPPPDANQVYKVPIGASSYAKWDKTAKVTIIQYSDFQCPFCSRVEETISQIGKDYAGKGVRLVWKNNPLPFHQNAMPAAEAAMAAGEQGKFWEMHAKLFANQQKLERADLENYAKELGLNLSKFKAALDSHKYKKAIEADVEEATKLGARGTPSFFINGRLLRGAQPLPAFKQLIDEEMAKADALVAKGVKVARIYDEVTKDGLEKAAIPTPRPGGAEADDKTVYKAEVGSSPVRGGKNAKVTIVIFSDFQCPFCSRVEPTIDQALKTYGKDVRVVWKNLPLPFHQNAMPAAEAAMAAGEQGKFWEMHDLLFKNQQKLERADLEAYGKQLGLNQEKFKAALDSHKFKKSIDEDAQAGGKIGARGTPTMFINGKLLVGAQPFEAFKAKIDEELKNADELIKKGTPASKVYEKIMASAKSEAAAPAAPQAAGGPPPVDKKVYRVEVGDAPAKGPKNAPVQIVVFSDFQCPFCARVEPTLKQVEQAYPGKVRIAWKNYPLPMHQNAMPAAEAAMAAGAQGKFWPMHDKLFANQQSLSRGDLERYAKEIGLDMSRFRQDLDAGKYKNNIQQDMKYADGISGPIGTPTMFINGRKIEGAYPFESFKQVIEESLAKN